MNKDYILFAFNNLRSRKLRSWLTMLGIFIGIAAVVALIGLGEGLRTAVLSQFGFLGSDVLTVQASGIQFAGPPGQAVSTPLSDDLTDKIEHIRGVDAAINRHIESGAIEFNDRQHVGIVTSLPEQDKRKVFERMVNLKAAEGRLLDDSDDRKVVLGHDYSADDIFEKKGSFIFDHSAFLNEDALLDLFGNRKTVDAIAVKAKETNDVLRVKEEVEQLLRKERDVKKGEENFIVESPQSTLDSLNSTLFAVQLFVSVIAAISLLVGGIGIMNTMYTSVVERTR